MIDLNQSDHDTLIRLSSQLDAHIQQEAEVSRGILSELTKLTEKLDNMRAADIERARDLKDLKVAMRDDDIRIATLEQQVGTLQDAAEKAQAVSEAIARVADRRIKQWSVLSGAIVFVISNGPTILAWLNRLVNTAP